MSLGGNRIEEFEREMEKLDEEQACAGMLVGLDQEVPSTRCTDYFNTEVKTEEEPMYIQPPLIHLGITDDALSTSNANTSIAVSGHGTHTTNNTHSAWHVPFIASTNANSFTFSTSDSKDSLNTPTPFCSNAVTGLKWEPSIISSSTQSPFLSSAATSISLPVSATTDPAASLFLSSSSTSSSQSSSIQSSAVSSLSTSLHEQSYLCSDASSSSLTSSSSFCSSDAQFDLTPPPSSGSSSSSSSLSSSPPSSFLQDLGFATDTPPVSTTKRSTYITNGLAGSGCTIVSNVVNFLNEPPQQALNEAGKEYTDLDKQPFSFYDGLGDINMDVKELDKLNDYNQCMNINSIGSSSNNNAGHMLDDPDLLQSLQMMHETLQKDCEELNIPFDPMLWTANHVQLWVSSLCQKNNLPDVSPQMYPINGSALFSLSDSAFQQYGESGSRISLEIACCKAAKSVMLQETLPQTISCTPVLPGNGLGYQQQTFLASPCVSPSPSTCSNGQASSTGFSTPSDHSDDEGVSCNGNSVRNKVKGQYKAKKSRGGRNILLWQFLKELLLSEDPSHTDCIKWLDRQKGIFKIEDSKKVAYLWGQRKDHHKMNYDKLSRSIRQYYKKGIIKKTEQSRRLVYQFCHK